MHPRITRESRTRATTAASIDVLGATDQSATPTYTNRKLLRKVFYDYNISIWCLNRCIETKKKNNTWHQRYYYCKLKMKLNSNSNIPNVPLAMKKYLFCFRCTRATWEIRVQRNIHQMWLYFYSNIHILMIKINRASCINWVSAQCLWTMNLLTCIHNVDVFK